MSDSPVDSFGPEIPPACLSALSPSVAAFYGVLPMEEKDGRLVCACADPDNTDVRQGLTIVLQRPFVLKAAAVRPLEEAIRRNYGIGAAAVERMDAPLAADDGSPAAVWDDSDPEASIGRFVRQLLLEAVRAKATDVHIETVDRQCRVRYRIDGFLRDVDLPRNIAAFRDSILSRIKIMASLNIAERRRPQDGRTRVRLGERELDLRVSILPTVDGESAVLRLLNSTVRQDIAWLGLSDGQRRTFEKLLARPHGLIFVTGPTGSGKTTTLYAGLNHLHAPQRKIITIEDPVEYRLPGIIQIPVNAATGLSFADGLRSMLRHDPDVMMVGEVRDEETARIAVQISLTGHLVLSTLHTNDAASGVTRLLDMGIEPYLITSAVTCFIAQRLVRRICPHCRSALPSEEAAALRRELAEASAGPEGGGFRLSDADGAVFQRGAGCEACRGSGYAGREAIYEFMVMDETLKDLVLQRASAETIRRRAVQGGMMTLAAHGWHKVCAGITTPAEVIRVTQAAEDTPPTGGGED